MKKSQSKNMQDGASAPVTPVLCDICVEGKTPALKTCLKCEFSMCAEHLETHLTRPVFWQTHPLVDPSDGVLGVGKCSEHGKLLEYYCLDDCSCVCVACSIEHQHRNHNMKTLPSAHMELLEKLKTELKLLTEKEGQGQKLRRWEKKHRDELEASRGNLVKSVCALSKLNLQSVQTSVSARLEAIRTARENTEAALMDEEAFVFLQKFAGVHSAVNRAHAVDLREGLELQKERDELIMNIQQCGEGILKNAAKLQCNLMVLVDPEHHQNPKVEGELSDIKFDPQTLGPAMSMSLDHKTLFYTPTMPYTTHTVFAQQDGIQRGLHWIAKLSKNCDWSIGISDRKSRGRVGLKWQNNKLSLDNRHHSCIKARTQYDTYPTTVEVLWDFYSKCLQFYSRGTFNKKVLLYEIQVDTTYCLLPFVTLMDESQRYSVNQIANLWVCPCKKMQPTPFNAASIQLSQKCHCGRMICTPYTEVLCEILRTGA